MIQTRLDHIVVGATTLEQGVNYIRDELGVEIPKGGEHVSMGTHNHVMQLGNDTFLEVIAINPDAQPPLRPRWFGLDDPGVRASLLNQPRILTWVVNTSALDEVAAASALALGVITPFTRNGLNWMFAVPDDGRLLGAGMLPNVMQWQTSSHPSGNMADLNCRLTALHVYHPYPQWVSSTLNGLHATELINVHALETGATPYLTAEIDTPNGLVVLRS